ncbi:MAG: hypothetical protein RIC35_11110 [Marinoscillum sp.]
MDKRLDFTAYFLATIQSLEHHKISFDNINTTCKEIAHEYVRPKNNFQKWFKKPLPRLINTKLSTFFLNKMDVKIRNNGHTEGFRARVITDKAETFGFGYGIDFGMWNLQTIP